MSSAPRRADRRRSAAHLFLRPLTHRPKARGVERLLDDALAAIPAGAIREDHLRVEGRRLFGRFHQADQSITINVVLLRVTVGLHELIHRARPWMSERGVRRATVQLLHALDDDGIDAINARLVAAIRSSR